MKKSSKKRASGISAAAYNAAVAMLFVGWWVVAPWEVAATVTISLMLAWMGGGSAVAYVDDTRESWDRYERRMDRFRR